MTNFPTHFHNRLFETIAKYYDTEFFFFSDGKETWADKQNDRRLGEYKGHFVNGIRITSRWRLNTDLVTELVRGKFQVFIQSINGRFELLATFVIAKVLHRPFILWTNLWFHPKTTFHQFTFPVTRFIYRNSDAIVAYGYHVRDFLVRLGVNEDKITYSWNVTDNSIFNVEIPAETLLSLRHKHQLKDRRVILFVGRLSIEKGLRFLIDGFAGMNSELNTALLIIGDGPERESLVHQASQNGKGDVVFIPYVPNAMLASYYALADVFVLPSVTTKTLKEVWGIVINEAMNQGCAIIATSAVGAAVGGLLEEGKNGMVVPEGDAGALRLALEGLFSNQRKLQSMQACARDSIRHWDHMKSFEGFRLAIDRVTGSKLHANGLSKRSI